MLSGKNTRKKGLGVLNGLLDRENERKCTSRTVKAPPVVKICEKSLTLSWDCKFPEKTEISASASIND